MLAGGGANYADFSGYANAKQRGWRFCLFARPR
jgi:hypothetical protein